jgi:hypothetical protein
VLFGIELGAAAMIMIGIEEYHASGYGSEIVYMSITVVSRLIL